MIVDITGIELIPGDYGRLCPGNGTNPNVECCCEECDYQLCCFGQSNLPSCQNCADIDCPHAGKGHKE